MRGLRIEMNQTSNGRYASLFSSFRSRPLAFATSARGPGQAEIGLVGRPDLDLDNPAPFAPVLKSVVPDMVINAAAHTGVDQQEDERKLCGRQTRS
ncbi:sugar nucleotide-binding protein [Aminobacter sp. UC22_36]|uniref:sugar nucleotide-binding protein n=1 Tax=Aminobacter sp. UC22_36 TaxID=3374549 RepID=UPI003756FF4F